MSTEPILLAHSFCQRPQVYLPYPSPCGASNVLGAHRQVCYDATSHAQHLGGNGKLGRHGKVEAYGDGPAIWLQPAPNTGSPARARGHSTAPRSQRPAWV